MDNPVTPLPFEIEKWLITIKAHCYCILNPGANDDPKEFADQIVHNVDEDLRPELAKLALSPPQDVAGLVEELQKRRSSYWDGPTQDTKWVPDELCNKAADTLLSLSLRIRELDSANDTITSLTACLATERTAGWNEGLEDALAILVHDRRPDDSEYQKGWRDGVIDYRRKIRALRALQHKETEDEG